MAQNWKLKIAVLQEYKKLNFGQLRICKTHQTSKFEYLKIGWNWNFYNLTEQKSPFTPFFKVWTSTKK